MQINVSESGSSFKNLLRQNIGNMLPLDFHLQLFSDMRFKWEFSVLEFS